ncbi:MAG: hypothetical protein AB7E80_07985 [Hyphomicrobiaceae bacterium]
MDGAVSIELKPVPDGYGFIYGRAFYGGQGFDINVMPPEAHWAGDFKLAGYEPHTSDWILFVDGQEVGRVAARADVEAAFARIIAKAGCYT